MTDVLIRLARGIESSASALTDDTIEAAPGGTLTAGSVGLSLLDLQKAVRSFADAYAAEVARAAA